MCKTIAIANQKGGTSKSTSTFNISAALAGMNMKVLMLDLDPQASLTISAGMEPLELKHNVCDILKKNPTSIANCIYKFNNIPNLSIVPSIIDLAALEMDMQSRTAREKILTRALGAVRDNYNFILIDCPPQLSILTINALSAADNVIIPCKTSYLDYRGLEQLESTIMDLKSLVNERIELLGVIATMYERIVKDHNEILELLRQKYNTIGVIKKAAEVAKVYDGLPMVIRNPNNEISKEYIRIAQTIIDRR